MALSSAKVSIMIPKSKLNKKNLTTTQKVKSKTKRHQYRESSIPCFFIRGFIPKKKLGVKVLGLRLEMGFELGL